MLDATSFISTLIAYYVQPSVNNKFHVLHRSANSQLTLVLNNNVWNMKNVNIDVEIWVLLKDLFETIWHSSTVSFYICLVKTGDRLQWPFCNIL